MLTDILFVLLCFGHDFWTGCRSSKAGEEAVAYLKSEASKLGLGEPSVLVIPLDLSSQQSITDFVKEVKTRKLPVSLLVNNAGVMFIENWPTKEGYEVHFGVNHLGHFKLIIDLLDVLAQNGPSRIVTVTSDTYIFGTFEGLALKSRGADFHRWYAYCDSKLMNLLCVRGLHRHLQAHGLSDLIKIYAVHPGSVATGIARGAHSVIGYLYSLTIVKAILNLLTPRDGASGTVFVALSREVENQSGQYFSTTYMEQVSPNATHKEKQEDQLLQYSERCTNTNLESVIKSIKRNM
jgi:NAD(P)-dependent dehydrogenase (short-subunit alcohol dehydrogenase family)